MGSHRRKAPRASHPCFVTLAVRDGTPIFAHPELAQKVLDVLRAMQEQKLFALYAYVVIDDYVDLVLSADELEAQLARFRTQSAREILAALESSRLKGIPKGLQAAEHDAPEDPAARLWQDNPAVQPILDKKTVQAKVELIHHSPVKRGYVADPTHYRYSSARNYAGQPGLLPVITEC